MSDSANDPVTAALSGIQPAAAGIDRDTLLYEAGYAAGQTAAARRPAAIAWRATACVATAACVAMLAFPKPQAAEVDDRPIVVVAEPRVPQPLVRGWDLDGQLAARPRPPAKQLRPIRSAASSGSAPRPTAARLLEEILSDLTTGDPA